MRSRTSSITDASMNQRLRVFACCAATLFAFAPLCKAAENARIIKPDDARADVEKFNSIDDETVVNLIPNAKVWEWMVEQVPFFQCPDKQLEEMYYFRWWTYRKHIKQLDYICLTEFLGRENPVSSAVGHHIREGRWMHDKVYLDQ